MSASSEWISVDDLPKEFTTALFFKDQEILYTYVLFNLGNDFVKGCITNQGKFHLASEMYATPYPQVRDIKSDVTEYAFVRVVHSSKHKLLHAINYITDCDTGMYDMGEIDSMIQEHKLREYMQGNPNERAQRLLAHFAKCSAAVINMQRTLNQEEAQVMGQAVEAGRTIPTKLSDDDMIELAQDPGTP